MSKEAGGQAFQLKVFVCGRNRLENKAAKRLAEFFKVGGIVSKISLSQHWRSLHNLFSCSFTINYKSHDCRLLKSKVIISLIAAHVGS